jgi:D-alanyl-lipoteichoic acid acyltransferase DltB (MBOAT superfamily)
MRDYIFYPLSLSKAFTRLGRASRKLLGNSLGKLAPTFLAMVITFLAVGIWHGANWKFVAYGLYNGLLIFSAILLEPLAVRITTKLGITPGRGIVRIIQIIGTFLLVCIGRYFSRATGFMAALRMLERTFSTFNPQVLVDGSLLNLGLDAKDFAVLFIAIFVLLGVDFLQEKGVALREKLSRQALPVRWLVYFAAIFAVIIFGVYGIQFNASSFIYMGF